MGSPQLIAELPDSRKQGDTPVRCNEAVHQVIRRWQGAPSRRARLPGKARWANELIGS